MVVPLRGGATPRSAQRTSERREAKRCRRQTATSAFSFERLLDRGDACIFSRRCEKCGLGSRLTVSLRGDHRERHRRRCLRALEAVRRLATSSDSACPIQSSVQGRGGGVAARAICLRLFAHVAPPVTSVGGARSAMGGVSIVAASDDSVVGVVTWFMDSLRSCVLRGFAGLH